MKCPECDQEFDCCSYCDHEIEYDDEEDVDFAPLFVIITGVLLVVLWIGAVVAKP